MMRALGMIVVAAAAAVVLPAAARAQGTTDLKIAYVDSEELVQQAPGYEEAKQAFDRATQAWTDSLQVKRNELQTLFEDYKKQEVILSPEVKTEKQEEMLRLEQQAQQYFQTKFGPDGEAAKRQAELMQPIIERVNVAIDQVRAEGGYALIFDLNDGALVAGDPALNITDQVVQRLRGTQASSPSR
jgi:outer membrane protein